MTRYADDTVVGRICSAIADGETLKGILRQPGMPSYSQFSRWRRDDEQIDKQYFDACIARSDAWAEEVIELADNCADHGQRDRNLKAAEE